MRDGSSIRSGPPAAGRNLPAGSIERCAAAALVLLSAYIAVNCLVTAWFSKAILDGESASVLSVAITFAETGRPAYPLYHYVHHLFGFTNTVVHPPLHYALSGLLLAATGYGPLQFTATSLCVALAGIAIASAVCWRLHGAPASALVWIIAAVLRFLYDTATSVRSDVLLGFLYLLTVLTCAAVLFASTRRLRRAAAALAGLFAAGSLAAHYYGLMTLGLALFMALALIWRLGAKAWPEMLAATFGGLAGLGFWYLAYGPEFLKIAPFMSLVSAVADIRIDTPFGAFWAGVLGMPGGWIFLAGVALFAVQFAIRAGQALTSRPPQDPHLVRDGFLLYAAVWPVAYLWGFTDNHNYRYWIDLIFVGLIVSSAGITGCLAWLAQRFERHATTLQLAVTFLAIIALAWTSPAIRTYFTVNPATLRSPDPIYQEARARIKSVVPGDAILLTGTPGYPYVHDYRSVSTMDLIMQALVGVTPPVDFARASSAYREKMSTYPRNLPGNSELATLAGQGASHMLVGPDCHFWSCRFYVPEVTRENFRKSASIVLLRENLTGRPTPNLRDTPRLLSVFVRKDQDETAGITPPAAPAMERSGNVGFIRYPQRWNIDDPLKGAWQNASPDGKTALLWKFLEERDWFGLSLPAGTRQRIVDELRPRIDAAFAAPEILELSAAFDYALIDPRAWAVFPVAERK